jgi:hypothetical protein
VLLAAIAALLVSAAPAAAQPPVPGAPSAIDGPSSAILRPASLGLSIARDGSGGLVYLKAVGGTAHVFVSQLTGGSFHSPVQADLGLSGASSQPVIAAGNGGLLLVAFINGGQLYVVQENATGQFGAPRSLAASAANPAIAITNFGKAYLAFVVPEGAGHDVRSAYYVDGTWALESPPLNATPADNAGIGTGRPAVAAAGDGIAIVAWGENGHIYTRRVWGTAASVVDEQADAAPPGCTESSASDPLVGAGGDSSYAPVAFQELDTCGGHQESRVLMNLLQGSRYDGITQPDGLSGDPAQGADDPQLAVAEYGEGWVTSARTGSNNVFAGLLSANGAYAGTQQVNSLGNTAAPYPVPAVASLHLTFIAWQQEPGPTGGGEIRLRYAGTPGALGPETIVSSPAQGPTDAADGIAADGDVSGDVAVAWLQGPPGATRVMVEQMYQAPTAFAGQNPSRYTNGSQPVLAWNTPIGWGPMRYSLFVDGALMGQTYSNFLQVPVPLTDGRHNWRVIATNPVGQQNQTRGATIFVDTVPPTGQIRLLGRATLGSKLHVSIGYGDHPPVGQPAFDASGVAEVTMSWGDGTLVRVPLGKHLVFHQYRRAGRYQITLLVVDKAGNATQVVKLVKVVKPKRPKKKTTKKTTTKKTAPKSTTGGTTASVRGAVRRTTGTRTTTATQTTTTTATKTTTTAATQTTTAATQTTTAARTHG